MHQARSVANNILSLANTAKDTLTPMQLMKLTYLCHGWLLGIHGKQLVKEPVEAWLYGPVIPDLYHATKDYRSSAVQFPIKGASQEKYDEQENCIIKEVYEKYGKYSGPTLSALTHEPNSPWCITWNKYGKNAIISNDLIEEYYRKLATVPPMRLVQ